MAEAILFGIAGSLLKNLGSRALDEIASARGFKTHLEKLKNTVNTIKDVLLDAEERQEEGHVESHAVRGWLDRLKTPLYAADDLFDEFATVAFQWEAMGKKVNKELTVLKKVTNSEGSSDVGSSKLKRLRIDDVEVLISMPVECLGHLTSLTIDDDTKFKNTSELEEVFKHLSSLTSLKFSCCPSLASISVGMEHLVSLESLVLYWCSELDISEKGEIEDGMPWKALTSLRELELLELNKLKQLPSGLQHLTNLRHLRLFSIPNIEEVPEWIGCLSSLEYMEFEMCDKLTCFPEEMRNLTSLNLLRIEMCSRLTKRCRGPNGADWPYIRHIPHLIVQELPF